MITVLLASSATVGHAQSAFDGFWTHWFDRSDHSKSDQPHWVTPLATTTPRLEQEVRSLRGMVASRTLREWSRYELMAVWLTILAVTGGVWLPRQRTGMVLVAIVAGFATMATAGAFSATKTPAAYRSPVVKTCWGG